MKITNIDKFRTDLCKNLNEMYISGCEVQELLAVEWSEENVKPENKKIHIIRKLNNPIHIRKYHVDDNWKAVTDAEMYICIDDSGVDFYRSDFEDQGFRYMNSFDFASRSKTVMMMEIAVKVAKFAN